MIFCNSASLMFMPAEEWGLKQSKIAKIYASVHLLAYTEN